MEASSLALPPALTPVASRVEPRSPAGRASLAAIEQASILPRRLGRYHLFAHIGRGGMADIYLAQAETALGDARRLVVVKEMLPMLAHSAQFSDMLVAEAKLAARLNHANIVKVEDLGRAQGSLFIGMEYVEGLDLRELLRRCAKARLALPVEFSLRVVIEALRGLSCAHRARDDEGRPLGIVHRDVSPSNVLLSFEGEVKVCDFGIARAHALAGELPEETIAGKAGYMSPEQARGEALDARADVFAAGIILWEMLAGRRLYKAGDGERLLDLARAAVIPDLRSLDLPREGELYAIVAKALRVDREERYASAAAMLHDLEEYAMSARMVASQLRFGEWLMESFGHEVVRDRRARERVMRALAKGPAAVIVPIYPTAPAATRLSGSDGYLPEYDNTPSAFPVALRADSHEAADETPLASTASLPEEVAAKSALVRPEDEARPFNARVLTCVLVLAAIAYGVLRVLLRF